MAVTAEVFLSLDAQQLEIAKLREDVASCHRETAAVSQALCEVLTELPTQFLTHLRWHGAKLQKDVAAGNQMLESERNGAAAEEVVKSGRGSVATAPGNVADHETGGGQCGGDIYVCGGFDGISWMSSMEKYCSATGSWEVLPSMESPRSAAVAAMLAGKLYICGGRNGPDLLSSVECFDSRAADGDGSWEVAPSMSIAREGATASVLGGVLYVCGGLGEDGQPMNSVEMLGPESNAAAGPCAWQMLPPMLEARAWATAGVLGSLIYVCGGEGEHSRLLNSVECGKGSTWQLGPPMLEPRMEAAGAALAGQLLICGGRVSTPASRSGERFDSAAGTWDFLPLLPVGRDLAAAVVSENAGKLFIFGGGSPNEILSSATCFDTCTGEWVELPALSQRRWGAAAACCGEI